MTAREFTPRPYQELIIDHMLDVERGAAWAGMGMGKTSSTLATLNTLQLLDNRPVLIVAPLRVARSTWPDEVRKWKDFRHMSITPVIGSVKERAAALKYDSNIYTTNFENLPWLIDHFGEARWPFSTVVVDEATKLKGFRLRQGTARAKALARVAHTKVKRFIELTGTPAPNGLADLWGQAWFLDRGQALGKTYDAFRQRWFEKSYDGYSITPKGYAQEQIQRALAHLCITIEAKDWFDLKEPIVTDVRVTLPAKARALYEDMEKRMFMELDSHEVEAFGAAARTVKCIAAGTELLTSSGWKPIEQWQPGEMLWDGVEWVNADKLVCNGYMPVVKCLQVAMTSDHKVLTTDGWKTAEEINNADASKGFDRAPVRLPDGFAPGGDDREHNSETRHLDVPVRMRKRDNGHRSESDQPEQGREKVVRMPARRNVGGGARHSRQNKTPGVGGLVPDALAMPRQEKQGLAQLRCTRHFGLRFMAVVREFLERYVAQLFTGHDDRAKEQQRQLRARELRVGEYHSPSQQQTDECVSGHPERPHDDCTSGARLRAQAGYDRATHSPRVAAQSATESAPVYDLVNCGPRHRFTVRGADGAPLIVHNCLQIASGAAYVGETGSEWREIHDAKLDALEDILEESGGMPILVAYHFKSDLARLQKAFPQGRQLDADPKTIEDWNAGKIPLLFAHPASAGHGLNLQDGGNILVFFSHWWNLEERMQIIERIGPTRQLQAGHDRAMFIYNIIADGTVDDLVIERVNSKREVQDILLDAMKRRGIK